MSCKTFLLFRIPLCLTGQMFEVASLIREFSIMQTWCRGKKKWESELLCMDCYSFSWRSYSDPDFKTPEEYEREKWESMMGIEAH